jgi:trans-aconitate 2-methyltransferase
MWDPDVYLTFADHRGRPFADLLSRVGAPSPRRVVDLGCGAGNLTGQLARRWPEAAIEALDSSPEMVAAARAVCSMGGSTGRRVVDRGSDAGQLR